MRVGSGRCWCLWVLRMLTKEAGVEEGSARHSSPDFPPWTSVSGRGAGSRWGKGNAESWESLLYSVPHLLVFWERRRNKIAFTDFKWTWILGGYNLTDNRGRGKNKTLNIHPKETDLTEWDYLNLRRLRCLNCPPRPWPLPRGMGAREEGYVVIENEQVTFSYLYLSGVGS